MSPRGTDELAEASDPAGPSGALCIAGDLACAQGDLPALASLAARLALGVPEPLHCELVALAALCRASPDEAVATWMALRDRLFPDGGRAR